MFRENDASNLDAMKRHRSTSHNVLEHSDRSVNKSCSFKGRITVRCASSRIRSSCRASTQEGSTRPLLSWPLYLCSVSLHFFLSPETKHFSPLAVSNFHPCSPAHGCLDPSSSLVSQLAPPTRPVAMGKRAQLLRAIFTLGLFSMLKKSPLCLLPLASALWTPRLPLLASVVALVCWGDGGSRISSGSVAEQRWRFGD